MCGIAGWIGSVAAPERVATSLREALKHRGPDDARQCVWRDGALVHTRLRILDLTEGGAQPMSNEDATVWTVFNGEIYNHTELRRELENQGHAFRGRADTEVLPHLYEEHGSSFVGRLHGMFAAAIYEPGRGRLLLARDRFGIKPLFYAASPDRLVFASEINALRAVPDVDVTPDPQAISDYLALFNIPAPFTFYRGIRALAPGHILEAQWSDGRLRYETRPFHAWTIAPHPEMAIEQAVDRAESLLQAAVRRQLESDVPLGALLSGGIDSSLVSTAAQSSLGSLQTYNVRLPGDAYDESSAAVAVSRHIHSSHSTIELRRSPGTWESVTSLLMHAGQPFADTSMFGTHAVSRVMRRHVTVALSGDGGDEGFGGYGFYTRLRALAALQRLPGPIVRTGAALLRVPARVLPIPRQLPARVGLLADADDADIVAAFRSWIRRDEHERLSRIRRTEPVRRWFVRQWPHELQRRAPAVERLSALATEVDVRLGLPNDMLFKVDLTSMREGLEVRVPMLDEALFELGLSLPHALKASSRAGKRVLRGVARRRLPTAVATRPKHGFGIPVDAWVTPGFKSQLRRELLENGSRLPEVASPEEYRPWLEAFCSGKRLPGISREGLYQRAVMLLSLHLFLR